MTNATLNKYREVIKIANDELSKNCLFFKSPLAAGKCPRVNNRCHMRKTCEAIMKLEDDYGQS